MGNYILQLAIFEAILHPHEAYIRPVHLLKMSVVDVSAPLLCSTLEDVFL